MHTAFWLGLTSMKLLLLSLSQRLKVRADEHLFVHLLKDVVGQYLNAISCPEQLPLADAALIPFDMVATITSKAWQKAAGMSAPCRLAAVACINAQIVYS